MSNTATLKRTDRAEVFPGVSVRAVATALAGLLLAVALITFKPFNPNVNQAVAGGGGDIVNQLGYSSLGALAVVGMLCFANPRVLTGLVGWGWMAIFCLLAYSVMHALDPAQAARAALFTTMAVLIAWGFLTIPRNADDFSLAFALAAAAVLGLSYAGIVALPNLAKHTADSLEAQHAGLWRGVFLHKNIAGPVMACFAFGGFYLYRRGWKWIGGLIFAAAMIFTLNTGSKTTVGLVPVAMLAVSLPTILGLRALAPVIVALTLAAAAFLTIGTAYIEPLHAFGQANYEDPSFTGRMAIWEFAGEMLAKRPWTGYGLESFWGTSTTLDQPMAFDREWDVRSIVHGHNGYLDLAIAFGLPGMALTALVCFGGGLVNYLRVPLTRENVYLADFFLTVLFFTGLNALLESFFFRRVDPVWLFFLISVFGLRLVARFEIKPGACG